MKRLISAMVGGLLVAGPAMAQQKMEPMMTMSSSTNLADPMNREGSGTSWLPDSTPMYAKMKMLPNGDMVMLHGAIMPRYVNVGSKRGDRRFDAPNWVMGMYSHPLGTQAQLGLRAMLSLDPITEGGYGYPLLYQTGETWHHQPLHDRQHPHDLFSELSATYSRLIGHGNSLSVYVGYPGEPALGPPTFMHRLIAYDLADAPIGHHWQDATHITFGVATVGLDLGKKFKVETSSFTGREPDENRYNFDKPRFDSYSGRLSFNPDANTAFQVSYGYIKNAEGDGDNQHRTTASWLYNRPLGDDANFATSLVWGQNSLEGEGKTNSYLAEANYQNGSNTLFARFENIQKSGHELVLPAPLDTSQRYTLGAYTIGYVRDLTHGTGIDTGIGAAVTLDTKPTALNSVYGTGSPTSFQIFFRFRPSRLKMATMHMASDKMDMGNNTPNATPETAPVAPPPTAPAPSVQPMPMQTPMSEPATKTPEAAQKAPVAPITLASIQGTIAPNPPKSSQPNTLTVLLIGSDTKPIIDAQITSDVAMKTMDMGTSHPKFTDLGSGHYSGKVTFSMAGSWRVNLHVILPGSDKTITKALDFSAH